jgi:glucosylceramidase
MNIKVLAISLVVILLGYFRLMKATSPGCDAVQAAETASKQKQIKVVSTYSDKRFADEAPLEFTAIGSPDKSEPCITVDLNKQYQKHLGIGAAPTDAACYVLTQLDDERRKALIEELFSPEQMGFNFLRTPMGASDYATHAYSYCDSIAPDPKLEKFNIDHDKKYILPRLREILAANPAVLSLMSPWSPPGWMKPNKTMFGGNTNREYLNSWVEYFVKTAQAYRDEGVPVYAFTIQNEPSTDQERRMPASMTSDEVQSAVLVNLARRLKEEGFAIKLWCNDHNYSQFGVVISLLDNPDVLNACDGVAWHGYTGDPGKMTFIHNMFPSMHQYWTEGGPDITNADYQTDWAKWARVIGSTQRNWCRTFIAWNLALDEKGQPNIGPFPCGGVVTINSKTGEITRSGQYYGMGHYSKFIKRDAVRVDSQGEIPGVTHVAWVNPDGGKVLVLTNEGDERKLCLSVGQEWTKVSLPANSVTTLTW